MEKSCRVRNEETVDELSKQVAVLLVATDESTIMN
jgi:hypothetical protein